MKMISIEKELKENSYSGKRNYCRTFRRWNKGRDCVFYYGKKF